MEFIRWGERAKPAVNAARGHRTPNSYINYPFLEADQLAALVQQTRSITKRVEPGQLTYPVAGNLKTSCWLA